MIKTGLVSVTFRQKTPEEIIEVCERANLSAIEWGSDVHVPAGDTELAKAIGEKTRGAGLEVASYGSYYRLGEGEDFEKYITSAVALGAPNIRVWAGIIGTKDATDGDWKRISEDAVRISRLAAEKGLTVSLEYHANTLTDTVDSTLRLLTLVPDKNFYTYWQPPFTVAPEAQLPELKKLLDSGRLSNVHVYERDSKGFKRLLVEGESAWRGYLKALNADGADRFALLEFVMDDDDEVLIKDAALLNRLINVIAG